MHQIYSEFLDSRTRYIELLDRCVSGNQFFYENFSGNLYSKSLEALGII